MKRHRNKGNLKYQPPTGTNVPVGGWILTIFCHHKSTQYSYKTSQPGCQPFATIPVVLQQYLFTKGRFGQMFVEQQLKGSQIIERRAKQRIYASYPAMVQGKDTNGKKVRANATLTNFSSIGLCLILKPQIHLQGELFVLFHCSVTGSLGKVRAPTIAIRGNVVRSGMTVQGMQSMAVNIRQSRFL